MITVTDLFCGAGGSSSGLTALPGVRVLMAANHWKLAIDSHQANHPDTDHDSADISQVEPSRFPTTDILWASPECTNHSVAKGIRRQRAAQAQLFELGGEPLPDEAAVRSRATMWDVPRFAEYHQYRAIIIENVVDAYRWVPFPAWLQTMELLGYEHEIVWLNSMHAQALGAPAPQSRDRMYVVFWRKGNRRPDLQKWTRPRALCERHGVVSAVQVFKKAERWGRYRAQYLYRCPRCAVVVEPGWLPAASAIDWSLRGQRIGDRAKPLAAKTRARIEAGLRKYAGPVQLAAAGNTYDAADPRHPQHESGSGYMRVWSTGEALRTQSTSVEHGVAVPPLVVPVEGREGKAAALASEALRTQSTRNETGVLVPRGAFIAMQRAENRPMAPQEPLATMTTGLNHALVVPMRNHGVAKPVSSPIDTVSAEGNHHALLMRNNTGGAEMTTPVYEVMRTLTTGGHQSSLDNIDAAVDDCEFRMLEPHEIKVGMAFSAGYILLGNKREQVKQSGNAVTPPVARDLGAAVLESLGMEVMV